MPTPSMKLTKLRAAILISVIVVSAGSYVIGRSGIKVSEAITHSRCQAGAFIAHSKSPSSVQADAHSDESAATVTSAGTQVSTGTYAPVELLPGNLIANADLEQALGARPKGWDNNSVGSNAAKFSTVAGYNSDTALRTDISNYQDGTADWFGPSLTVTPGYYQFQDVYRASSATRAVLQLTDTTGKSQYINLDAAPATTDWLQYTQRFYVPSNIKTIMVSHPLDQAGWLETDAYSLRRAVAPSTGQAMVSVTFDDGWRSIYDHALPLLKQYNVPSTQYIVSGFLGSLKDYMTPAQIYDFQRAGSEIASHTVDHPDLTQLSAKDLTRQLKVSRDGLTKCFGTTSSFAAPFGANNQTTTAAEKALYESSRSTEAGFNSSDTLDLYRLKVQNVRADTSPEQIAAWVDTAKTNHVWLILVYHQVDTKGGEYSRTPADLESDLKIISASGVPVKTVHDAVAAQSAVIK